MPKTKKFDISNEELATRIQNGETELIPQLWEQVEKYVRMRAGQLARKVSSPVFDSDDLTQEAYFALLKAIEGWRSDGGLKFISYFTYCLQTAFAECGGWRTEKGRYEWDNCPLSLDTPLYEDNEGNEATLSDIVPCPCDDFETVEACIYNEECRAAIEMALETIPAICADVIRAYYLEGKSLTERAEELGVSQQLMQQRRQQGLRELRKDTKLAAFYYGDDDVAAAAMKGAGLNAFRNSGMSATVRTAIAMTEGKPIMGKYPKRRR